MSEGTSKAAVDAAPATGVSRVEAEVESTGGARIHVRRFRRTPEIGPERALLAIVPGFSDHGDRYAPLVERALAAGVGVASMDTRGHGLSSGPRGHVERFDDFSRDVDAFVGWLKASEPLPLWILGHSMGALIVLNWLSGGFGRAAGVAGAIVQAPPFQMVAPIPLWKTASARLLSRVWPTVPFASPVKGEALSRDPRVGERYFADPLVHQTASPRLYTELTGTAARLFAHPVDYGVPTLFLHGEDDTLAGIGGTRGYFERSPLAKKRMHAFPAARHELHNDAADEQWRAIAAFMGV